MAGGLTLASAYIELIPSLQGAQRAIQRQLGPIGDRAGQQFGQDFNSAATSQMQGSSGIGGVADDAGSVGSDFGKKFGAAAALAIGAAVGASIVSAVNQEVETDRVSAALGASPREAARLGALAGDLYSQNFGDSVGGVATAIESVRSSFRSLGTGKDLETVTAQALTFADVFQIDLPRAVSVAQTVVRAGLAKDATGALDLLTAAAQRVPAALRENILDAADEYGQFFRTVGFGGEATFTALAENARAGEFGIDKAGDAIKEFTILSTDMSTSSVAAYDALGLSASEMANAILAGGPSARDATQKIVGGLLDIKDPATQASTAIALFGTPLEDLGVKNIPRFLKSLQAGREGLGDFSGAIDRAGATAYDNAASNLESFKRQVTQTFVNEIGGKALPALTDLSSYMSTNFGPALTSTGAFLVQYQDFLVPVAAGITAIVVAMRIWRAITVAFIAVQTAFNIVLTANPIGLIVLAIVGLGAAIVVAYNKSETFRGIVDTLFAKLRDFGTWISTKLLPVILQIGSFLLTMASNGIQAFTFLVDAGLAAFEGILIAADKGLGWVPGLGDKIGAARQAFGNFRETTVNALNGIAEKTDSAARALDELAKPRSTTFTVRYNEIGLQTRTARNAFIGGNAFARGTNFAPGGLALVGEEGPELVTLPRGSRVDTASATRRMAGSPSPLASVGGGGGTVASGIASSWATWSRSLTAESTSLSA
jgi:hypothetical protein